ncbi:L,D-transpeptidase family protein [Novosphingobium sp. M1R2S20]|uniref:L,D-transpeptidase family protein n=1 Tax=Novosphingobium rhizovicinum TaxID=3228928 RepID=A0ABV3RDE8_9SPHN
MNGRTLTTLAAAGLLTIAGVIWLGARSTEAPPPAATAAAATTGTSPDQSRVAQAEPSATPVSPEINTDFVVKRILPIDGPIKYGEWHWNEDGVPPGPVVITVDLDARVLSIFRSGHEIGAAAVLLGTEEKPTPLGVFPITQKRRHHVSNLYDAPMPYMMRLTNDGITLHGSKVEWGYASHGCVGMPEPFAAKVFSAAAVGDRVFITRGKMLSMGDSLVGS